LRVIIAGMTHFYTGKGDDGYTGLLGEGRVPKYHPRTEAVGALDEATAALGMARAISVSPETQEMIITIQQDLYGLMAEVAATGDNAARFRVIDAARVSWLEDVTDVISSKVEMPNEFILPGDTLAGASIGLSRTIVRRAERRVAELIHNGVIENIELLRYLNRLSSLCFVLELWENQLSGKASPTLAKKDSPH
jgi:cob(I)alamin adenosyltransferase